MAYRKRLDLVAAAMAASILCARPITAQTITAADFAARRQALAARVDSGVVVAFGGRALVHDFSGFYQLPSFHYLTNYDEPDGAFVMVVRGKRGVGTLFTTQLNARTAFYYGQRADSASAAAKYGMPGRPIASLRGVLDSLAKSGLPFYT